MICLCKYRSGVCRRIVCDYLSLVHDYCPVRHWQNLLQPVLGDYHRGSQLPVNLAYCCQEVSCRNGVKLRCGFIQNENLRLHCHYRSQIKKLFLASRKLADVLVEPPLNAEKACHFRNSQPNGSGVKPQVFKSEGQLVPHLVRNNLGIGILKDIAYLRCLLLLGKLPHISAIEFDCSLQTAMGSNQGLQISQQRCLTASGSAAEHHHLSHIYLKTHIPEGRFSLFGICKCQIFDSKCFHTSASLASTNTGK